MTDKQKQNVERILAIAKRHLVRSKKEAAPAEAIMITHRENDMAAFFRDEAGIEYDDLKPR